jgi:thiol-disulfide isomerase/thioredoxin
VRYRLGLLVVGVLAAGAIVVLLIKSPAPPSLAGGSGSTSGGGLLAVDQRVAAPDFTGIDSWINSSALSLPALRGHVVLVDFWTFSCVNCVRTLPHLETLYESFKGRGFVLVGVHSPEFDFETVKANVDAAVRRLGVNWPVALDSQMATWNAYGNQYWPAEYLIDQQGRIAYVNFGEGMYDATDAAVANLLGAAAPSGPTATAVPTDTTPELYAGSQRGHLADGAAYGQMGKPQSYPDHGPPHDNDAIQVTGTWIDEGQYLQAASSGHVRLNFHAGSVFVVAGTSVGAIDVAVALDGKSVPMSSSGPALIGSRFAVSNQDLYHVLTGIDSGSHTIDLAVPAGFQLYTFTFG